MLDYIAHDEGSVFSSFSKKFDVSQKNIVEIGGCVPDESILAHNVSSWTSVDPSNPLRETSQKNVQLLNAKAESIPLDGESIDYIFSSNAFQHVDNFYEVLIECRRILKRGGILFANFGPIWSAPDGSHVENLVYKGKNYNFWEHCLLPFWSHLVYEQSELSRLLSSIHGPDFADAIANYVFHSTWINRHFYDDYTFSIDQSGLKALEVNQSKIIDYYHTPLNFGLDTKPIHLENLKSKFGRPVTDISTRDLQIILQKT